MKKTLLTVLGCLSLASFAQQGGRLVKNTTNLELNQHMAEENLKSSSTLTTILLSPFTGTNVSIAAAGSDTSTPGCSPNAGYVFGSNCYKDLEKAQFFAASAYSTVTNASVTGMVAYLFKDGTEGTGGANNVIVTAKIYTATTNTAAPGALLGQQTASMGAILAGYTGTSSLFVYTYTFTSPVPVSGPFYAAITTPTTAGDTIALISQTSSVNRAWEKWDNNNWYSIQSAWGYSVGMSAGLGAIVTGSLVSTFLSDNGWLRMLQIFPNPSNGNISLNIGLDNFRNIEISVTNIMGQEIYRERLENHLIGMHHLNLTHLTNGIYFLNIQSGSEKRIEKIIIRN
jgi:hypothetical protein